MGPVVYKSTFDGFFKTDLERIVRGLGATSVLLSGLVTSACVLNTALGAFHRGFDVMLIEECCADRSMARHEATLAMYSDYCFRTIHTADLGKLNRRPCCPMATVTGGCGQLSPVTTIVNLSDMLQQDTQPLDEFPDFVQ